MANEVAMNSIGIFRSCEMMFRKITSPNHKSSVQGAANRAIDSIWNVSVFPLLVEHRAWQNPQNRVALPF